MAFAPHASLTDAGWPGTGLDCIARSCVRKCCFCLQPDDARRPAQVSRDVAGADAHPSSSSNTWRAWVAAFGVEADGRVEHGPALNEMSLAIDAAVAGHGIALARDLAEGRLVRPIPEATRAEFAYRSSVPKPLQPGLPWFASCVVAESVWRQQPSDRLRSFTNGGILDHRSP